MENVNNKRPKMPISHRAKQFLPFDAVAGLRQALRMKEHEMGLISRKELSEESREEIDEALCGLDRGSHAEIDYFAAEDDLYRKDGAWKENGSWKEDDLCRVNTSDETGGPDEKGEIATVSGVVKEIDAASGTLTLAPDEAAEDRHGFTEDVVIRVDDIVGIK